MQTRVLRVIEYTYPSAEDAIADRERWGVQGIMRPRPGWTIKSAVVSEDLLDDIALNFDTDPSLT